MKFLYKYGTSQRAIRRARRELYFRISIVLAIIVFFAFMVLISRFRPRLSGDSAGNLPDTANVGDPLSNPQLVRLRAEVEGLVGEFTRRKGEQPVDPDDLNMLETAIERQREVIRLRGSEIAQRADLEKLEDLLSLYDEEMGGFLISQSLRLEQEAQAAWDQQDYATAVDLLESARNLQQRIDGEFPRSTARNPSRLHQLNNRVLTWQTQPLAEKADQLRDEAFQLAAEHKYEEAKFRIAEAVAQQQALNQSFRNSRFASISRLKQLEEARRAIDVAEDTDRVQVLISESRAALDQGRQQESLARAEEAAELQRRILAKFPDKPEPHRQTLALIEALRDTGASLPVYNRILDARTRTRDALLARDFETFKSSVSEWLRETQNLIRNYPGSEFIASVDDTEITFLHNRREEVPAVLEMVYAKLLPIPGHDGLMMLGTEVSQALYSTVTGKNPSNLKSPGNPVDSVTWEEVREFNTRLGWILARPVSLPSREQFLSALGSMPAEEQAARSWSSDNTVRETQPAGSLDANDAGFHDLLGNVAEWLDLGSSPMPERVVAIGGAARDSRLRLAAIPEELREPNERNRYVGFRFVVGPPAR